MVTDARSALEDVVADARCSLGLPRLPKSLSRWLAEPLLLRIRDFVKAHPFRDGAGHVGTPFAAIMQSTERSSSWDEPLTEDRRQVLAGSWPGRCPYGFG